MAFVTAPTFPIREIKWGFDQPSAVNVSPYSGVRRVSANPWHGKWRAQVELGTLQGEANAAPFVAFMAKCDGQIAHFKLPATAGAQNSNSGVQVLTDAAQGASSLTITGAATAMIAGQRMTVNDQLLAITDVSGSTLTFRPRLREAANAGTSVETANPYALVYMATSDLGWNVGTWRRFGFSFEAEEAVGERVYSAYKLALDFDAQQYYAAGTKYAALSSVPGYAFTRAGEQGAQKLDGTVAYYAANAPAINSVGYHVYSALTNLLLNAGGSGNLATQSVTVSAVPHTLSFIGTGTVTLSGVSTAGPLVGTGASTQVRLNFTPTAGTLTLTVTGTVQYAGLMAATLGVPVPIIATAGATAGIGASDLAVNDAPTSEDQLFLSRGDYTNAANTGVNRLATWQDGTTNNMVQLYKNTTSPEVVVRASGAEVFRASAVVTGEVTVFARRLAGNWRAGCVKDGVLTWFGADTAAAFPTGMTSVMVGRYTTDHANIPVTAVARIAGAFDTDAKILAIAADLA